MTKLERREGETGMEFAARRHRAAILEEAAQRMDEFANSSWDESAETTYRHAAIVIRDMAQE